MRSCDKYLLECSSPCDFTYALSPLWWTCFGIGYVLYVIECYMAGSHKFVRNTYVKETVYEFVRRIQLNRPTIWWKVECYHWETRTRTVTTTDSNGNTQTRYICSKIFNFLISLHFDFFQICQYFCIFGNL